MLKILTYRYSGERWIPMHTKIHRHAQVISPYGCVHPWLGKVIDMAEVISTQIHILTFFFTSCAFYLEHKQQNPAGSCCLQHAMSLRLTLIWLLILRFCPRKRKKGIVYIPPKHFSPNIYIGKCLVLFATNSRPQEYYQHHVCRPDCRKSKSL